VVQSVCWQSERYFIPVVKPAHIMHACGTSCANCISYRTVVQPAIGQHSSVVKVIEFTLDGAFVMIVVVHIVRLCTGAAERQSEEYNMHQSLSTREVKCATLVQ
jgi:hypothetical protein